MSPREDFLLRVFQRLDQRSVEYCVARNADTVFVDGPSDVDLLARARDVGSIREACEAVAAESSFVLAQATRFANHSWIFAHESGALVRIDVDTEVRWRWCHVLNAEEVLRERQRGERFPIPAPQHEAAILRAQIAWRGEAPARYADRLAALGAPVISAAEARRSLALAALAHPFAALAYAASDAARCFERCFGALRGKPACEVGASVVLAGLDGAGKTTFARALLAEVARSRRFTGVRYFHWIPSPFRRPEFPWPANGDQPRRAPQPPTALAAALSAARLARNIALARIGFALVVRPLVRRGWLVIIDRYVTNYWLDPASVRYAGPTQWLDWARQLFPHADSLISLSADAATLRSRKGELSDEQISAQIERLRQLPSLADRRLDLDATKPVQALVAQALDHLGKP